VTFGLYFAASVLFNLAEFRRATLREIDSSQNLTSQGRGTSAGSLSESIPSNTWCSGMTATVL
jgi:hypothetical protein